jgi:hypothetical protein
MLRRSGCERAFTPVFAGYGFADKSMRHSRLMLRRSGCERASYARLRGLSGFGDKSMRQ